MSQTQWEANLTSWFIQGTFTASIIFAVIYITFFEWEKTLTGKAVTVLILAIAGALFRDVLIDWGAITPKTETAAGFPSDFFTWLSIISLGAAGTAIILLIAETLRELFAGTDSKWLRTLLGIRKNRDNHRRTL